MVVRAYIFPSSSSVPQLKLSTTITMQSTYTPGPVRDPFNNAKYSQPNRVTDPFNVSHARGDTSRRGSSYTVASYSTRSSRSRSRPSSHTSDSSSPSPSRTSRSKSRDGRPRRRESVYETHHHDCLSPEYAPRVSKSRSRSRNQNSYFPPIADTLEPPDDYFNLPRRASNASTLSPQTAEVCRCKSRASVRSRAISFSPPSETSILSPPPPYSRTSPTKARASFSPPEYRHRSNSIYSRSSPNKLSPSKLSPKPYNDWDVSSDNDSDEDYDVDYRPRSRRPSVRRGSNVSMQKDNAGNRIAAFLASLCNLA